MDVQYLVPVPTTNPDGIQALMPVGITIPPREMVTLLPPSRETIPENQPTAMIPTMPVLPSPQPAQTVIMSRVHPLPQTTDEEYAVAAYVEELAFPQPEEAEAPMFTTADLRAPTETRIHSCGPSWCDLIWKPVSHAFTYVIFLRSRSTVDQNEAEHNLRYHLRIPDTLAIVKACRFRVDMMLPSRLYEIHVAAGDQQSQIGPLSDTLLCRTAHRPAAHPAHPRASEDSIAQVAEETGSSTTVTVFKHKFCDLVSSKRKRTEPHPKEVPVVPCVVMTNMVPRTASSCVSRCNWNPLRAKTLQCKFPACGQLFKLYGNKTRHERSCRRDVCKPCYEPDDTVSFKLHCRWQNCDYSCAVEPRTLPSHHDGLEDFDIQEAIPAEFMQHLETHMPKISTKAQRTVQVWCQWRGCHKVPMYAQSLHRHVKESHIGFGNRYNTGQGGVPIQTEAGLGTNVSVRPETPLPSHPPPAQVPLHPQLPSLTAAPPTLANLTNASVPGVPSVPLHDPNHEDTEPPPGVLDPDSSVHWTHTILPGPQQPYWQCYPQVDVETLATSLNLGRPIFDGF